MNTFDFIALDIETANSKRSSICEIGLAFVKDGKVAESKSWLIRPHGNLYDGFNIYIHGITPEMTENSPSFKEAWTQIAPLVEGQIVVAHNTAFDMYALYDAFSEFGVPVPRFNYLCSLRISRKALPGLMSYSLPDLCHAIGVNVDLHHRAEADAISCANVFLKVLDRLGSDSFDDLTAKADIRHGSFDGENHIPQRAVRHYDNKKSIKVGEIVGDESQFDEDNYFYGKSVCFTGAFSFGIRADLLQLIANVGGIPMNSVTKQTNVLVVGQQDYRVVGEEGMSSKQKKAISLIEKGQDLEIMSEVDFLQLFM